MVVEEREVISHMIDPYPAIAGEFGHLGGWGNSATTSVVNDRNVVWL